MRKIIVAVVMIFSLLLSTPANAHESVVYQGKDRGWVGENHFALKITDKECDSHFAWILWQEDMTIGTFGVKDKNGCDPGGVYGQASHNHKVTRFQVCEYADDKDTWFCTDWHKA